MKRINLLLPALLLLAVACKHKPQQPAGDTQSAQDSLESPTYLPVADFIKSDIVKVDSFAGGILKKKDTGGKKDSAYIQPAEFHRLASQFIFPELDSATFHDHFTEHSLMDETTEMLNFIYTAKEPAGSLRSVMVYLRPSLATDQVKRVYMERSFNSGDTAIDQKLTWKMMEYFYVITIRQPKNGPAVTSMEKVIWDPQYFAD
ncbi:hypothetical protein A4H97_03535 [Niastella yeongjuensis]|uniref:Lipoprotein n=1 Tax=Niastella yeongjuensis TaxID=354355 RepID=A0A1V9EXT0_9BACT|nr:hypothetical protein [Niastella yeongjuensis]OQP50909.1 hypothetical protein A4H97_03535 [Niastella yeongjuensis]SEN12043.1 hypothetical protein SAMN05660816_00232 [Niastella yeongjuensis]